MKYAYLYIPGIVILLLPVIRAIYKNGKESRDEEAQARQLREQEWHDWHERAMPHLQAFMDRYFALRDGTVPPQDAQRVKRECISEWQSYFGTSLDRYETRITPKKYLVKKLGSDYDPCMEEHYKLERQLDRFIRRMNA